MNGLKRSELEELKALLLREKSELERHFEAENGPGDEDSITDAAGELVAYDNHPGDLGTEIFERERDMAVDGSLEDKLAEVNAALARMAAGSYGRCAVCGQPIPPKRLRALPAASACVKHAADGGMSGRPVEEQVMTPPPPSPGRNGTFDNAGAWQDASEHGNSDDTVQRDVRREPLRDLNRP